MERKLLKHVAAWGFALWLFGYILGIVFFPFVPVDSLGWYITPFGVIALLGVLLKEVEVKTLKEYFLIGIV